MSFRNIRGFSLIEVLMAVLILGIVGYGLTQLLSLSFSGAKHVENRTDLESIRQLILGSIDCPGTFATGAGAAVDPLSPTFCNTTSAQDGQASAGKYFRLRRRSLNNTVQYLTPPLVGGEYGVLGEWAIRVTCDAANQSLVIRAAKPLSGGAFAIDPLTKKQLGWYANRALLFGFPGALPVCYVPPEINGVAGGRLTLDINNAVPSADVTGGNLYYIPYRSNQIALFDATAGGWRNYTFNTLTLSLGGHPASSNFDVYVFPNASGTPELELSAAWSSDTVRGASVALTKQDGVWTKTGATNRRYIGTIRTSASGTTADTDARRFVWNLYNRVPRRLHRLVPGAGGWVSSSTVPRAANGSAANRVEIVVGDREAVLHVRGEAFAQGACGSEIHLGVNSTTVITEDIHSLAPGGGIGGQTSGTITHSPRLGYSYYQLLDLVHCGTNTFFPGGGLLGRVE